MEYNISYSVDNRYDYNIDYDEYVRDYVKKGIVEKLYDELDNNGMIKISKTKTSYQDIYDASVEVYFKPCVIYDAKETTTSFHDLCVTFGNFITAYLKLFGL